MSDKQFDWDAFNKVLQGSGNICAGARKDIENAVAAGKGVKPTRKLVCGQIWTDSDGSLFQIQANGSGKYILAHFDSQYAGCHAGGAYSITELQGKIESGVYAYQAKNFTEYLAKGGKV